MRSKLLEKYRLKRAKRKSYATRQTRFEPLEQRLVLTGAAPIAFNDAFVLESNTQFQSDAPGVLANDVDEELDALTAHLFSGPQHGELTLNEDGSFIYTPHQDFVGIDSFLYMAHDGTSSSALTAVTLRVRDDNAAPVAADDLFHVNENSTLTVKAPGILQNDTDADGDSLIVQLVEGPQEGTLELQEDGSFVYTPEADFTGEVTFTYRAFDGVESSNIATVSIIVDPVNLEPIAVNDRYQVNENETLTIDAPGVLNNDSDPENDPLQAVVITPPLHGTLEFQEDGSFTYTPDANYSGLDGFTYQLTDGTNFSDVASVTIDVLDTNEAPTAENDEFTLDENTVLEAPAGALLENDTDPDGDPLIAVLVSGPSNGQLELNDDGSFTYTPDPDFVGTDYFVYQANDGTDSSNEATVTLIVNAINEAPTAENDEFTLDENTVLEAPAGALLENDTDPDGDPLTAVLVSGPSNGQLELNDDGSFTYTPDPDFVGTDSFVYQATDGTNESNEATVTLIVNAINEAPTAENDEFSLDVNTVLEAPAGALLENDTDPDGDPLTAVLVSGPSNGQLELNDDGSFTYTPDPDFVGTDYFVYQANDGTDSSNEATVTLIVNAINEAPTAENDEFSLDVNTVLEAPAGALLENDTDPDGDPLTAVLVSGPSNGQLELNDDGSFTYTPDPDFVGTDSFVYQATDGTNTSNEATVTLIVNAINEAPTAEDDEFSLDVNTVLEAPAGALLENDTDPDGDPLTAVLVSGPSNGQLELNDDGSFTYTPDPDFVGTDSFVYQATDGTNSSNEATVTLIVNAINEAPTAEDDEFLLDENTVLEAPAGALLENDIDPDGDPLTAVLVSGPSNGQLELNDDGSFTYTPDPDFVGTDSFVYQATDGTNSSNEATVTLIVNAINEAPTAEDDEFLLDENTVLEAPAGALLENDIDPDGDPLTAVLVSGPSNGQLELNDDGSFTYTPDPDFVGTDSFVYLATDGTNESNEATVTLIVNAVNEAPTAENDSYVITVNETLEVAASGVLENDMDPEGDPLTAVVVQSPEHGTLTLNDDGSFVYVPDADFTGLDGFSYQASDGNSLSDVATVTIEVLDANAAPEAVTDAYETSENTPLVVDAAGVLENDTDPEGDPLEATLVTGPEHGTLSLQADGSFTYTPNTDFVGTDRFVYQASDGQNLSEPTEVLITVTGANHAPFGRADYYSTAEDVALTVGPQSGVLRNDTDADGDSLSAAVDAEPQHGTLELSADGSFVYTPAPDFFGIDSFSYRVSDGMDESEPIQVQIAVSPVNDAPVATEDAYELEAGTTLNVEGAQGVLANDTDVDSVVLEAQLVESTQHGTLTFEPDGSFSYTPNDGFVGTDSFRYQLSDGEADSDVVLVTLEVLPSDTNTAPQAEDDAFAVEENGVLNIGAPGVLSNDVDSEGNDLTASLVTEPSHGTVVLNADGSFTYTPNEGYVGTDSFQYVANDGELDSEIATVAIEVQETTVESTVIANNETYIITAGSTFHADSPGVLANDVDEEGDPLTAVLFTGAQHGTLVLNADGSFEYTPNDGFEGLDAFIYSATDGVNASSLAVVTLRVIADKTNPPMNEIPSPNEQEEGGSESGQPVEENEETEETTDEIVDEADTPVDDESDEGLKFVDGEPQQATDEAGGDNTEITGFDADYLRAIDDFFAQLERRFA